MILYLVESLFSAFVKLHPQFRIVAWEYPFDILDERAFGAVGMIPIAHRYKLMFCKAQDAHYLQMFAEMQAGCFRLQTWRCRKPGREDSPGYRRSAENRSP
jgi:hypothetical protein